jgi:regulator of sirC expression with transglutaminase-like and TPR domain
MPGHFLVRDRSDPDAFFDPFGGGVRLDAAGCRDRFRQLHPAGTAFAHGYLEPVPSVRIVTRILGNLTNVYLQRTDLANLTWVLRLRTFLPGARPEERRQLAGVLANRGVFWEAADEYEVLAGEMPERAERYRDMATRLRARRN